MNREAESPVPSALARALLAAAFGHRIREADADTGLSRLAEIAGAGATREALSAVLSEVLTAGYIHDPVRLPAGALQCHWHLELTPAGIVEARRLRDGQSKRGPGPQR